MPNKKVPDVPIQYKRLTDEVVNSLVNQVNRIMPIIEELGAEIFIVDTDKFKVTIGKRIN